MNALVEVLFATLSTGIAIKSQELFGQYVKPDWLAPLVFTGLGVGIFFLLHLIWALPGSLSFLRKYFGREYGIEGYWYEKVTHKQDHPHSLATIEYSPRYKKFTYYGTNYNKDFTVHAEWTSNLVVCESRQDRITFLFEAELMMPSNSPEPINGQGKLSFRCYAKSLFHSGVGDFTDIGKTISRSTFEATRIYPEDIKRIIGRRYIKNAEEKLAVVKAIASLKQTIPSPEEEASKVLETVAS